MRRVLMLLLMFILVNMAHSQSNDELKSLIETSSGQQKSQYLIQLSNNLKKDSPKEAFDYAVEGLQLADGNSSLEGAGNALAGQTALALKDYNNAAIYAVKAAEIYQGKDEKNYAVSVSVAADAYAAKGDFGNAIKYDELGCKSYQKVGNDKSAGFCAVGVAEAYSKQKNNKKAIEWYQEAADLFAKGGDPSNQVQCLTTKGALQSNFGDFNSAKKTLEAALDLANKSGLKPQAQKIEEHLNTVKNNLENSQNTTAFEAEKNEETEAYIESMEFNQAKSLAEIEQLSEEVQLAELKVKAKQDEANLLILQNQKLAWEAEQALLAKDLATAKADAATAEKDAEAAKASMLYIIIGALLFFVILILIGFVLKNNSNKKLQLKNKEILSKNEEISNQRDEILKQTKNIEQSMDYATKIQQALLPSSTHFKEVVPSSFVFLRPKDNVSGDFFWFHELEDGFIAAAADCTGHGVPGAFMSIIFSNLLDKVVVDEGITDPSQILESISARLTNKMKERKISEKEFKDGMDVSIVHINRYNELVYSGARNPIYIVQKGELKEIKGTRRSVGMHDDRFKTPFENHKIQIEKMDKVFLFSDGFPDQKGGPKGKKFYYQPFKELLSGISSGSIAGADIELNKVYNDWRGKHEQFDDVLVVGIEVL
ncbi:MAG: SpoIIE family protein phosphatase [Flavobacteriales bacterium]|nr:SpoIIE family protein phosphatase [Flavobacteriales bacterium]